MGSLKNQSISSKIGDNLTLLRRELFRVRDSGRIQLVRFDWAGVGGAKVLTHIKVLAYIKSPSPIHCTITLTQSNKKSI